MVTPDPTTRIADYLIERLAAHGVGHVFGGPGDFVLALMSKMAALRRMFLEQPYRGMREIETEFARTTGHLTI